MRLSELKPGERAVVLKVRGHGAFRKRITEMGFIRGKEVAVVLDAPLKDPVKYKIMDYEVSLRLSEAALVEVVTETEAVTQVRQREPGTLVESDPVRRVLDSRRKTISIALVGNPNCGKTSLFNVASGSHEHVGNYSGVTVDAKRGGFTYKGYKFEIFDLPGTYSLSAYSPEELFVRNHIADRQPDVLVNVVSASALERNLYLTTELIDMDQRMVIALNMYDELEERGDVLDYRTLGKLLGVPVVPTVSRSGKGIPELFDTVIRVYEEREPLVRHVHVNHGQVIESGIQVLKDALKENPPAYQVFSPRYLAVKLLEGDDKIAFHLSREPQYEAWIALRNREAERIEKALGEDIETAVSSEKYGFISGALRETLTHGEREELQTTRVIDSFATHKLFGFPFFLFVMWVMFEATFKLGNYPMEWIESGVAALSSFIGGAMADGMLKDLLIDGVIGGVGGVIVFLPNILILYFFISFMEDSGYMARAAFIMDKIMHRMGLHGKSFIPLIMGFGCNVPAIMAARTIESRSSRIITILINPFISCSARLPIYILLVGVFFPHHASLVFMGLYLTGIFVAVLSAKLLRRFVFKGEDLPFVMELPPYRMPTLRSTSIHMWDKARQYLRKMGGIILLASVVVWFLSYFPRSEASVGTDLPIEEPTLQQENSYLGRIGRFCEPAVAPLGFDWKTSVALLSGTAAKEIVVSTLGVLYAEGDPDNSGNLGVKLSASDPQTGRPGFTPVTALAFLVFVLLYFPCLPAVVAISNETGSCKWGAFSVVYNTGVAWLAAFLVYRIGMFFV